jgi:hypothetical protein
MASEGMRKDASVKNDQRSPATDVQQYLNEGKRPAFGDRTFMEKAAAQMLTGCSRTSRCKAPETRDPRTERGESASSADRFRGVRRT